MTEATLATLQARRAAVLRPWRLKPGKVLLHLVVLGFTLLWALPLVALFVAALRPQAETAASGWWMAFLHPVPSIVNFTDAFGQLDVAASLASSLAIALPTTVLTCLM